MKNILLENVSFLSLKYRRSYQIQHKVESERIPKKMHFVI